MILLMAAAGSCHAKQTVFSANDYGAKGDGTTLNTAAIQKAINAAAEVKGIRQGTVTLKPGTYLTGSLFLKSGVTLDVAEGVTLVGSEQLKDYPELPTRIAGIEMTWPAALVNVYKQTNATITGEGTIDGDGKVWWDGSIASWNFANHSAQRPNISSRDCGRRMWWRTPK